MGTTAATAAQPASQASPELSALQQFERELAAKYPGRLIKRFEMPSAVKQARAIYMMELTSRDEIQAAIYADAMMTELEKRSLKLSAEAERRECIRASIVGLVARTEPAYRLVAQPFHEIDTWPAKTSACLLAFFAELNSVPTDELLEGLKGARTIGASEPPTIAATPASASTGK